MSIIKNIPTNLYLKQWGLAFCAAAWLKYHPAEKTNLSFDWFTLDDKGVSKADHFVG